MRALLALGLAGCFGLDRSAAPDGAAADAPAPGDADDAPPAICATDLAVGGGHACAITGGRVQCWGEGTNGQLGDGTVADRSAVAFVADVEDATALGLGGRHSCAQRASGLWCWGDGEFGQLGDGGTADASTPQAVAAYPGALRALDGGYIYACAVTGDGASQCWGFNAEGQLGNGTVGGANGTPGTTVSGTGATVAIDAGTGHACAIAEADGAVLCWGQNDQGQLGATAGASRPTAEPVPGLAGATALALGQFHGCALLANGTVHCWGDHAYGQLGPGATGDSALPIAITGLEPAVAIGAGYYHTCAVEAAGAVKCWGLGSDGQLGNGIAQSSTSPVAVAGIPPAAEVAGGVLHTCLRTRGGEVYCVGNDEHGQLADGAFEARAEAWRVPLECP